MNIAPIRRGDSVSFYVDPFVDSIGRTLQGPTWSCFISFRSNGNVLDVSADSSWKISLSTTQTNSLNVGTAYFQIYATNGSEKISMYSGRVEVLANLTTSDATFDGRSQTKKDLDAVQTLIRNLISSGAGIVEYRIGSRQLKKYDLADLRSLESQLLGRLAREERVDRIKNGLGDPLSKYVRF